MRRLTLLFAAMTLTGCATLQADVQQSKMQLADFKRADVTQALTLAQAAKDARAPYRARCYTTLLNHLPKDGGTVPTIPSPSGIVSAFEIAVEVDAKVRSSAGQPLLPADVEADCAVVRQELERFVLRNAARVSAGVVGAGALPLPLN